jgi:hypothetical protein
MLHGWQLGQGMDMRGRCWLQQGGCGRGGKTINVSASTVAALRSSGAIKVDKQEFPLMTYKVNT